jgi:methyltransferase FkbM-like protein
MKNLMKKKKDNSTALCVEHFTDKGIFKNHPFTLIDVGCSGGINDCWRDFGDNLYAYGIDPVLSEIERLQKKETNPNVKYTSGYIGLPLDHPIIVDRKNKGPWGNNPFNRFSSVWASELLSNEIDDDFEKMVLNRWSETKLAKPELRFGLNEFVSEKSQNTVDFIKIDIDGDDYYALLSGEEIIASHQVLGMLVEVNYYGTDCETDHTFHNTDKLMRKYGFDLCDLTIRKYSKKTLPSKFVFKMPAETKFGVPYQGDALYIRDIVREKEEGTYKKLPIDKLCKIILIYKIYGLPDCAAEILLKFEDTFSKYNINIELILDYLTPTLNNKKISYREYISGFKNNVNEFRPKRDSFIKRQLNRLVAIVDYLNI